MLEMILDNDVSSYLLRHLLIQKQQKGQMRATQEHNNTFCNFLFCLGLSHKLNFIRIEIYLQQLSEGTILVIQ